MGRLELELRLALQRVESKKLGFQQPKGKTKTLLSHNGSFERTKSPEQDFKYMALQKPSL